MRSWPGMPRNTGCEVILTGNGGDEWLEAGVHNARLALQRLDFATVYRLWASMQRSYPYSRGTVARNLLWTYGLRPILGEGSKKHSRADCAWGPRTARAMALRADDAGMGRAGSADCGTQMLERYRAHKRAPRRGALDNPMVAYELEEFYESGRHLGIPLLHPFWDADLTAFLARVPPRLLMRDGYSKGLVRQSLAQKFPQLGFDRSRKVTASGFYRSVMIREGVEAWRRMGGAQALAELGVVDGPALDRHMQDLFRHGDAGLSGADPGKAWQIWYVLTTEAWLRPRLGPPDSLTIRADARPSRSSSPSGTGKRSSPMRSRACLRRQDVPAELIVVDDGSTDGTAELLARFAGRITVTSSNGRGVSAARNQGMALAQGELLVFLDADDLLPPHYLARFVEAAAAAPRMEVFHCGWRGIDFDDGRVLYVQDGPFDLDWDPFHALAAAGSPPISALAVRRDCCDPGRSVRREREPARRTGTTGSGWPLREQPFKVFRATWRSSDAATTACRPRPEHSSPLPASPFSSGISRVTNGALPASTRTRVCGVGDRLCSARRPGTSRAGFTSRAARDGWIGAAVAVACRPRLASTAWLALREKRRTG